MQNRKLLLRGSDLLTLSGQANTHQLALQARISASTVARYVDHPERVKAFDLSILMRLLVDGCGLAPDQVLDLKMGDVFEFVDVTAIA